MNADPRTLDLFPSEEISPDSVSKKLQTRNVEGSPGRDPGLKRSRRISVILSFTDAAEAERWAKKGRIVPDRIPIAALPLPRSEENYGIVDLRAIGFNECLKEISRNLRGLRTQA